MRWFTEKGGLGEKLLHLRAFFDGDLEMSGKAGIQHLNACFKPPDTSTRLENRWTRYPRLPLAHGIPLSPCRSSSVKVEALLKTPTRSPGGTSFTQSTRSAFSYPPRNVRVVCLATEPKPCVSCTEESHFKRNFNIQCGTVRSTDLVEDLGFAYRC